MPPRSPSASTASGLDHDLIVVGGGHAGIEAALVGARSGLDTVLVTLDLRTVGHQPCNPAIGGPAKGHLVREVDALGGEMGRAADATSLQCRYLNTRKGPSVRALRVQTDKAAYSSYMRRVLAETPGLTMCAGEVVEILVGPRGFQAVRLAGGEEITARACVVATGTFLRGRCHTGSHQWEAGRRGEAPATHLTRSLEALGFPVRRLKTGTPPRVDGRTLDVLALEKQLGDVPPPRFCYLSPREEREQLPCWILRTHERTHAIIRRHLDEAPLFSGQIQGTGPRYCPSIEDKVARFPDRSSHPIFLEPEGADTHEVYVQGLSTSLAPEVQLEVLRSLPGLERVEMIRPGYAVEYDAIDARELRPTLGSRSHPGLYLAGQVCGTSGYEEAAGQGMVAGLEAVRRLRGDPPLLLTRQESYLGVMIDDLTTQELREPYRMFTGRAEHRLLLRHDNADLRLTPRVLDAPHLSDERRRRFREKSLRLAELRSWVAKTHLRPGEDLARVLRGRGLDPVEAPLSLTTFLRRPSVDLSVLEEAGYFLPEAAHDHEVREEVEVEILYEGYIAKQRRVIERTRRLEGCQFPEDFSFEEIPALSFEGRQQLIRRRPTTLGQASRLEGVRAADVAVLAGLLQRREGARGTPSRSRR